MLGRLNTGEYSTIPESYYWFIPPTSMIFFSFQLNLQVICHTHWRKSRHWMDVISQYLSNSIRSGVLSVVIPATYRDKSQQLAKNSLNLIKRHHRESATESVPGSFAQIWLSDVIVSICEKIWWLKRHKQKDIQFMHSSYQFLQYLSMRGKASPWKNHEKTIDVINSPGVTVPPKHRCW